MSPEGPRRTAAPCHGDYPPPLAAACRSGPRRSRARAAVALLLSAALVACAPAPRAPQALQPEAGSGWQPKPGWRAQRHAVAAAHPLAAEAGRLMLREGGSAIDAAIAAQLMLALVEPQSSGLGGGAFLMHWDGRRVQAYDGRETAPSRVDERLFLDAAGEPLPFAAAVASGRSVGVPGLMRMLEQVHREHGRLPWARLFEPAIEQAELGFPVGLRLHRLLADDAALRDDPRARALYYDASGQPWPPGHRLRNPDLAAVLRDLARHGADALHAGPLAERIAARVQSDPRGAGQLRVDDLRGYRPLEREPLCHPWRRYLVCGMPPPSSGGLAVAQILSMFDATAAGPASATGGASSTVSEAGPWRDAGALHRYAEVSRLAFADRDRYVADPDRVRAPGGDWTRFLQQGLLSPGYLAGRAAQVGARSMGRAAAGVPEGFNPGLFDAASPEQGATTQVSVVDGEGRAVSLTSSIEAQFGARLMVDSGRGLAGGFLLNNQLTDFSFQPRDGGRPVANRVEPGKRPRSSMSPTLVFERDGMRLVLVTGSPGGPFIVHFVASAILATLGEGLSPQDAAALPNLGSLNGPTVLEAGRFDAALTGALRARGHTVVEVPLTSGTHTLRREAVGWSGGADPRREGVVAVD